MLSPKRFFFFKTIYCGLSEAKNGILSKETLYYAVCEEMDTLYFMLQFLSLSNSCVDRNRKG